MTYAPHADLDDVVPIVDSVTLDNGLQVVVLPNAKSASVAHSIWYKNGAVDDPTGQSGVAHFLEHLMFKGTSRFPAGAMENAVTRVGGGLNAFTSWNCTCYFEYVPPHLLADCMAFEADRMHNRPLDDETVATERQIVLAERGMNSESTPDAVLEEALISAALGPNGRPIIGWRHEIEALDREAALAYHRRFYTPENAILFVSGKVDAQHAIELAKTAYGDLVPHATPVARVRPTMAPPVVQQKLTLAHAAVSQPQVLLRFVTPAADCGDLILTDALELLGFYLGGGNSSLLRQRLVIGRGALTEVNASYWASTFPGSTLFSINGIPAPGVSLTEAEDLLHDTLCEVSDQGIPLKDLERCKTQMIASAVYAKDSHFQLGQWYGSSLCSGLTLDEILQWQKRVRSLTQDDMRRALKCLAFDVATLGRLVPATQSKSAVRHTPGEAR